MPDLSVFLKTLEAGRDLSPDEAAASARLLADPAVAEENKAEFLTLLAMKGETASEVAAFVEVFRGLARNPGVEEWAPRAIDVCGTGGDKAGSFNISTVVLFILAASGVPVLKHGNRSITSQCGSADLLEALGIKLEATPEQVRGSLRELGFVFFFAPAYHPAFKHIAPVRKALAARGQRSIFNILGPLINPGRPAHQLLGVFSEAWVPALAGALDAVGLTAGLVVHGKLEEGRGVDELTTATTNSVVGFGRLRDVDARWTPEQFGLPRATLADLAGGTVKDNLAILEGILSGRGNSGLVDTIVWNAAAALWIAGKVGTVKEGLPVARDLLLGGAVRNKITAARDFYRA